MLERFFFFFRAALRNMRQSPFLCIAAIGTVAVALTITAFFAIVVLNVQKVTSQWSKEVLVVAYLDMVPEERQLQAWVGEIEGYAEVTGVRFVTRLEAFERFREQLAGDADLLEGVESDILPASLEISLAEEFRNRPGVERVVSLLRANPNFTNLRYGQDWLEKFDAFLALLRLAASILGGFLIFAALFIVSNTIKLTIYARRDELEIMALVGGTSLFIKTPFLLEGALQGALGGGIALGGSFLLFSVFLQEGLEAVLFASGIEGIIFLPPSYQVILLAAGTLLGFLGSLFSLRRLVRA